MEDFIMMLNYYRKTNNIYTLNRLFTVGAILLFAVNCGNSSIFPKNKNKGTENLLLQIAQSLAQKNCVQYNESYISNKLYSGGTRTLYLVSDCDDEGWNLLGFTPSSNGSVKTQISNMSKVVTTLPYSGWGTNIEVTFAVTDPAGTLDVMAYGTGTFPGVSTTNPTIQLRAGSGCSLGYRSLASGNITDFTKCVNGAITDGKTYTYCLDFDRGKFTASNGMYTFGDMLAAWPKPCGQVTYNERTYMTGITFMEMGDITAMNPGNSGSVGFSANGITIQSFLIGNTIYQSDS